MTQPDTTQSRHPYAAVRRTLLAVLGLLVALAPAWPAIISAYGLDVTLPWVAGSIAVAAGITRVLAVPTVETWLRAHLPKLAAAPPAK